MLLGAVWPAVYTAFLMGVVVEAAARSAGDPNSDFLMPFGLLTSLHVATMVIILAAGVAYVVHAWRSPRISRDQRTLWVLVLLLGGPIAMPIYWWLHVRPTDSPRPAERPPSTPS